MVQDFSDSILPGVPLDVFIMNILPRVAVNLWDLHPDTSMRLARLHVGSMLAMRRVNREWTMVCDSCLEGAALRATMIFGHRFCRGNRMQYLQLHMRHMISLIGHSTVITVEHNPALLHDIAQLNNRKLYELVRLLRRVRRDFLYYRAVGLPIPSFGFYNAPPAAAMGL